MSDNLLAVAIRFLEGDPKPWQSVDECHSIDALEQFLTDFEGCPLKNSSKTIFAAGPHHASVMVIGDAPNADDTRSGVPFSGQPGLLLDRMLTIASLRRDDVRLTNVVFWRPPGNRTPTITEVEACLPVIRRHIVIARPHVLLLAGGTALKALFPDAPPIPAARGIWVSFDDAEGLTAPIPTLPIFHPSFLLRCPERCEETREDMLSVRKALDRIKTAELADMNRPRNTWTGFDP